MTRPGLLGFRISPTATQGIDWAALEAIWTAAGALDVFSAGWLSDHLTDAALERGGTGFESLTTAAARAHRVPGKWIGIAVLANTFRHPSIVAKAATAIDNATGCGSVDSVAAGSPSRLAMPTAGSCPAPWLARSCISPSAVRCSCARLRRKVANLRPSRSQPRSRVALQPAGFRTARETALGFIRAGADHVTLGIPGRSGPEGLETMAREVAQPIREAAPPT